MEPTESFNIRLDDFEANTRVALKELRDEKEFCDVTLACDGKQVSAHKVILARGSTFFNTILKQNPHPHPLLYLKGVKYECLLSMLDFVYTGEAKVNQKELQSFLDVVNDLQIKGLTEKNLSRKTSTKGDMIPNNVSLQDEHSAAKKVAPSRYVSPQDEHFAAKKVAPSRGNNRSSQSVYEEVPIDTSNIKVELDDTIHSTASIGMETNHAGLNHKEDQMDFKMGPMTGDWYEPPINRVYKSEENAHYWYEAGEKYKDVSVRYDEEGGKNQDDQEFSTMKKGRKVCSVCGKSFRGKYELKEHMRTHTGEKPYQCLVCFKSFAQSVTLKAHSRIHTGEKPFQCMVCFKRFTQSGSLGVHKKRCTMKLGD